MTAASLPPKHDLEAERVVVSALLLVPEAPDLVLPMLSPEGVEFYSPAHRLVWRASAALQRRNEPIDEVSVMTELRSHKGDDGHNHLESIGGPAALATMCQAVPAISNVEHHVRTVQRLARVRRLQHTFRLLAAEANGDIGDGEDWARESEARVYEAAREGNDEHSAAWYSDVFRGACDDVKAAARGVSRGIPIGLEGLERHLGGWHRQQLVIIGGRPGQGKTALTSGTIEHSATFGWGWLFLSLEMNREELRFRSLSRRTQIRQWSLRNGQLNTRGWSDLAEAVEHYGRLPIKVDDSTKLTPTILRSKVRRWVRELEITHPRARLGGVVIDHVQLTGDDQKHQNRNAELSEVSRALKCVAKEFNCVVVACSQLNRPPKGQKVGRPQLHDLRDTGSLEQDADVVVFVHRKAEYLDAAVQWPDEAELIVAKGRAAGTDTHHVLYDGPTTRFYDDDRGQGGLYDD